MLTVCDPSELQRYSSGKQDQRDPEADWPEEEGGRPDPGSGIKHELFLTHCYSQAKENADDLLQEKIALEKEKKAILESAAEKEAALKAKIKTIGNIVHDSVPVSDNEVESHPFYLPEI
jgi:hypothetical protein